MGKRFVKGKRMVFGWNRGGLAGPLRRGYSDPEAFLAEYVRPGRDPGACTPTLADSLSRLTSVGELTRRLGQLPPGALCVIEGCSTPGNLQALRSFLQGQGVADPRVIAFDLIDVPAVLRPANTRSTRMRSKSNSCRR